MAKLATIFFLFSIIFLSTPSFSLELTIHIKKVKEFDKNMVMELFILADIKAQNWQGLSLVDKRIKRISDEKQTIEFSSLKEGWYALRVFQDINSNGILDKSSNGVPLEPVGFSANPSLFGGEPTPEDSAIEITLDKLISINLKHRKPKRKRKKHR